MAAISDYSTSINYSSNCNSSFAEDVVKDDSHQKDDDRNKEQALVLIIVHLNKLSLIAVLILFDRGRIYLLGSISIFLLVLELHSFAVQDFSFFANLESLSVKFFSLVGLILTQTLRLVFDRLLTLVQL